MNEFNIRIVKRQINNDKGIQLRNNIDATEFFLAKYQFNMMK